MGQEPDALAAHLWRMQGLPVVPPVAVAGHAVAVPRARVPAHGVQHQPLVSSSNSPSSSCQLSTFLLPLSPSPLAGLSSSSCQLSTFNFPPPLSLSSGWSFFFLLSTFNFPPPPLSLSPAGLTNLLFNCKVLIFQHYYYVLSWLPFGQLSCPLKICKGTVRWLCLMTTRWLLISDAFSTWLFNLILFFLCRVFLKGKFKV